MSFNTVWSLRSCTRVARFRRSQATQSQPKFGFFFRGEDGVGEWELKKGQNLSACEGGWGRDGGRFRWVLYHVWAGGFWDTVVENFGLGFVDVSEVAFQHGLRGGGFGGAGKGHNGGVPIPGEWTCSVCFCAPLLEHQVQLLQVWDAPVCFRWRACSGRSGRYAREGRRVSG